MFSSEDLTLEAAKKFDSEDKLNGFREKFNFPKMKMERSFVFHGRSLSLPCKTNSGLS